MLDDDAELVVEAAIEVELALWLMLWLALEEGDKLEAAPEVELTASLVLWLALEDKGAVTARSPEADALAVAFEPEAYGYGVLADDAVAAPASEEAEGEDWLPRPERMILAIPPDGAAGYERTAVGVPRETLPSTKAVSHAAV